MMILFQRHTFARNVETKRELKDENPCPYLVIIVPPRNLTLIALSPQPT
jgi:hypothetical protein